MRDLVTNVVETIRSHTRSTRGLRLSVEGWLDSAVANYITEHRDLPIAGFEVLYHSDGFGFWDYPLRLWLNIHSDPEWEPGRSPDEIALPRYRTLELEGTHGVLHPSRIGEVILQTMQSARTTPLWQSLPKVSPCLFCIGQLQGEWSYPPFAERQSATL